MLLAVQPHRGFHNHVVLARLGPVTLVTFGLLAALGAVASSWFVLARQQQAGLEPGRYATALFILLPLLIVVGSRLFMLLLQWRSFWQDPLQILRQPGFAFQGGLLLSFPWAVALAWVFDLDLLLFFDTFALSIPLGHAIGRLGCYSYGCCHGKPTRGRLAVRYTNPDSKVFWASGLGDTPLHPTQLYAAAGSLLLFVLLNGLALRPVRTGQLAGLYLVVGSSGRFLLDFLRAGPRHWPGLTPFQLVSMPMIAGGALLLWLASSRLPMIVFASVDGLLDCLIWAARCYPCYLWIFALLLGGFSIHGPQVGRL